MEEVKDPHCIGSARGKLNLCVTKRQPRVIGGNVCGTPACLCLGAIIEGRVGQDEVRFHSGMFVVSVTITQLNFSV